MKPRLKVKAEEGARFSVPLPEDFCKEVRASMQKQFPRAAKQGEFLIEGEILKSEILLRLGYLEQGRLQQVNCEASLEYSAENSDAMALIYQALDVLGSMMADYLIDHDLERVDWPLIWKKHSMPGLYLQHSTVNSRLEAEANRILEENSLH